MALASIVFEGVLAVLLVVVAIIGVRVDRRITALRRGVDGVAPAISALNIATARAETAIAALSETGRAAAAEPPNPPPLPPDAPPAPSRLRPRTFAPRGYP